MAGWLWLAMMVLYGFCGLQRPSNNLFNCRFLIVKRAGDVCVCVCRHLHGLNRQ